MKFLVVLAVAAVAMVSAADVPACDLGVLLTVSNTAEATACKAETGFAPSPGTMPTPDKVALICKNTNCKTALTALSNAVTTECLFSGVPFRSGVLDKYAAACSALAATTTAPPVAVPTTTAPATTAPATTAPATTAPATTTPATTKPGATTAITTSAPNAATAGPSTPKTTVSPNADTPKVTPSGRCKV